MKLFGENLRFHREDRNLPLRKVAAYLDIDTSILSKIERGERKANKSLVYKIAEYFDLDQSELMTDYLSEKVAFEIYSEDNTSEILKVAEQKVKYIRSRDQKQMTIFNS